MNLFSELIREYVTGPRRHPHRPSGEPHLKGWGAEYWLVNTPLYCAKFLFLKPDSRGSMHYHVRKTETFIILEGTLHLQVKDRENRSQHIELVHAGESLTLHPGLRHRLIAGEEPVVVLEVSTMHDEDDSYRTADGDSQTDGREPAERLQEMRELAHTEGDSDE